MAVHRSSPVGASNPSRWRRWACVALGSLLVAMLALQSWGAGATADDDIHSRLRREVLPPPDAVPIIVRSPPVTTAPVADELHSSSSGRSSEAPEPETPTNVSKRCLRLPFGDPHGLFAPMVVPAEEGRSPQRNADRALCLPEGAIPRFVVREKGGNTKEKNTAEEHNDRPLLGSFTGDTLVDLGLQRPSMAASSQPYPPPVLPSDCIAACLSLPECGGASLSAVHNSDDQSRLPGEAARVQHFAFPEIEANTPAPPSTICRLFTARSGSLKPSVIDSATASPTASDNLQGLGGLDAQWRARTQRVHAVRWTVTGKDLDRIAAHAHREQVGSWPAGLERWAGTESRERPAFAQCGGTNRNVSLASVLHGLSEAVAGRPLPPPAVTLVTAPLLGRCVWKSTLRRAFLPTESRLASRGLLDIGRVSGLGTNIAKRMCLAYAPRCVAVTCFGNDPQTCLLRGSAPLPVAPHSHVSNADDTAVADVVEFWVHPWVLMGSASEGGTLRSPGERPNSPTVQTSACDSTQTALLPRSIGAAATEVANSRAAGPEAMNPASSPSDTADEVPAVLTACSTRADVHSAFAHAQQIATVFERTAAQRPSQGQQQQLDANPSGRRKVQWTPLRHSQLAPPDCRRWCMSFARCRSAEVTLSTDTAPRPKDGPDASTAAMPISPASGPCDILVEVAADSAGAECKPLLANPHWIAPVDWDPAVKDPAAFALCDIEVVRRFSTRRGERFDRRAAFATALVPSPYECLRLCLADLKCLSAAVPTPGECLLLALPLVADTVRPSVAPEVAASVLTFGLVDKVDSRSSDPLAPKRQDHQGAGEDDEVTPAPADAAAGPRRRRRRYSDDDDDGNAHPSSPPTPAPLSDHDPSHVAPTLPPIHADEFRSESKPLSDFRHGRDWRFNDEIRRRFAEDAAKEAVSPASKRENAARLSKCSVLPHAAFAVSATEANWEQRLRPMLSTSLRCERVLVAVDEPSTVARLTAKIIELRQSGDGGPREFVVVAIPPPHPGATTAIGDAFAVLDGNGAWKPVEMAVRLAGAFPNATWYGLLDDDTYVVRRNLAYLLGSQGFGAAVKRHRPLYVGAGLAYQDSVLRYVDGASGIFLNVPAMRLLFAAIDVCRVAVPPLHFGDVRFGVCMDLAGVGVTSVQHAFSRHSFADLVHKRRSSLILPVAIHKSRSAADFVNIEAAERAALQAHVGQDYILAGSLLLRKFAA